MCTELILDFIPSQKVMIDNQIEGTVIAVQISPGLGVQYRVEWFHGGNAHDTWLYSYQLTAATKQTLKIGFAPH